jgi:general secretion pathway protein L
MLADFLEWWIRQWLSLIPHSAKHKSADKTPGMTIGLRPIDNLLDSRMEIGSGGRDSVVLPFNDEGLAMLRAMPGAKQVPLRLILPSGTILERTVSLPLAVERDLAQVLHYEMNRVTPFAAADVFWDWTLVHRDKRLGKLDIRLRLAKRETLAPILTAFQNHGFQPDYVESSGAQPGSSYRTIWLKKERAARPRSRPLRVAALAVCGLLGVALCGTPFLRQQIELSAIAHDIARLQPSVAAAAALRRGIEADAESNVVLGVERGLAGDPLEVLAAVTDALPDGTWITDLTLQQRILHVAGESPAAAQLIGKLATVSLIGNPAFAAPVTNDADHHADVFAISAEIQP